MSIFSGTYCAERASSGKANGQGTDIDQGNFRMKSNSPITNPKTNYAKPLSECRSNVIIIKTVEVEQFLAVSTLMCPG